MSEAKIREVEVGPGKTITLETGRLAKQAGGAVVVRMGDTMVLCTAVLNDEAREGQSFFPLTVDYREKYSAGGKFPGGFIKREGRPTDKEVISSRLIDRALRPMFVDNFFNEVQVIANVISADAENDADVLAGVGASAALLLAGAPFDGPIAEVRVGRVDGTFIVNPTIPELTESDFNLIVAGKSEAIVMVEGEMNEVSEEEMIEALEVAHDAIRKLCEVQHALVEDMGGAKSFEYTTLTTPDALVDKVRSMVADKIEKHIRGPYTKETFYGGISDLKRGVLDELLGVDDPENDKVRASETDEGYTSGDIKSAVGIVEKDVLRNMILTEGLRIDGRNLTDIRDIWTDVNYLPRVHGSAIFTRGETQVLASVTLGTGRDVQAVDQLFDDKDKRFYLHYNFPPFSVGEAKFLRGTSRREVGHGMLAERALIKMLPAEEDFPYTIRIIADVLESNGSSSMASVCSGSMALMDAGVPIKKPVAGIAMGLIEQDGKTAILSDILGTEDHLGDMDFKVAGSEAGITALQMDIKIDGITEEIMEAALSQAQEARLQILGEMNKVLSASRDELSENAPAMTTVKVHPDKIRDVIGKGGATIRGIVEKTGAEVDIDDDGTVRIYAASKEAKDAAVAMVQEITAEAEVGRIYNGRVERIVDFGAFVNIIPGKDGLLHISQIADERVENVTDYLKEGQMVDVVVLDVDQRGRIKLSIKELSKYQENNEEESAEAAEG